MYLRQKICFSYKVIFNFIFNFILPRVYTDYLIRKVIILLNNNASIQTGVLFLPFLTRCCHCTDEVSLRQCLQTNMSSFSGPSGVLLYLYSIVLTKVRYTIYRKNFFLFVVKNVFILSWHYHKTTIKNCYCN